MPGEGIWGPSGAAERRGRTHGGEAIFAELAAPLGARRTRLSSPCPKPARARPVSQLLEGRVGTAPACGTSGRPAVDHGHQHGPRGSSVMTVSEPQDPLQPQPYPLLFAAKLVARTLRARSSRPPSAPLFPGLSLPPGSGLSAAALPAAVAKNLCAAAECGDRFSVRIPAGGSTAPDPVLAAPSSPGARGMPPLLFPPTPPAAASQPWLPPTPPPTLAASFSPLSFSLRSLGGLSPSFRALSTIYMPHMCISSSDLCPKPRLVYLITSETACAKPSS